PTEQWRHIFQQQRTVLNAGDQRIKCVGAQQINQIALAEIAHRAACDVVLDAGALNAQACLARSFEHKEAHHGFSSNRCVTGKISRRRVASVSSMMAAAMSRLLLGGTSRTTPRLFKIQTCSRLSPK